MNVWRDAEVDKVDATLRKEIEDFIIYNGPDLLDAGPGPLGGVEVVLRFGLDDARFDVGRTAPIRR